MTSIEKNGTGIGRRGAMVNAARNFLAEQGYVLEDHIEPVDKDRATAEMIKLADDDWLMEAQSEMFIATNGVIKSALIDALSDSGSLLPLGAMYAQHMALYFAGMLEEAQQQLPFSGPSDRAEWSRTDNAIRVADLRAESI